MTISSGTIVAASDNALGSGLVTLDGGTLALAATPTIGIDIDLAAASAGYYRLFNYGGTALGHFRRWHRHGCWRFCADCAQ